MVSKTTGALFFWLYISLVRAYVPAQPTNDTVGEAIRTSVLQILSSPSASALSLSEEVSYQVAATDSTGADKGAFVHFSEVGLVPDEFTTTPWVAFISCDFNATGGSVTNDIITLARDRGAVAAVLYSEWSNTCLVNGEYIDPKAFDPTLDVFTITKLQVTRVVESMFSRVDQGLYGNFNATMLNQSQSAGVNSQTYLYAIVTADRTLANQTSTNTIDGTGSSTPAATPSTTNDATEVLPDMFMGAALLICGIFFLRGYQLELP